MPEARTGEVERPAALYIALLLMVVVAVRLHELLPVIRVVKPALLATFGGLAVLLAVYPARLKNAVFRHPLMRLVLAYWGFMLVTAPLALYPGRAVGFVQFFLPGVVLVAAILYCPPTWRSLARLQAGLVVAAAIYALYVQVYGRMTMSGRLSAGVGMYDSNDMASLLALSMPLALGLARTRKGVRGLGFAAAALLFILVVVASGSRGGGLALGAGAVVYVLGMRGSRRLVAIVVLAAGTMALWSYSPSFAERMSTLTNLEEDYNTHHEYGRKAVWERGRQYIRENPVIGVGAGNFPIREGQWFDEMYYGTRGGKWSTAHNSYVQAFAELGAIGGGLFVALLLYGVLRSWRLWRGIRLRNGVVVHRPELLASLAAFAVGGYFLSHAYYMPMLGVLGLIALADASARTAVLESGSALAAHGAGRMRALLRVRPAPVHTAAPARRHRGVW
jgi:putative inorganic carbon (hco3(-)) transporter